MGGIKNSVTRANMERRSASCLAAASLQHGEESTLVNKYLHCFEGTIVEVHEQSAACKSRTVSKVRSKWAIVKGEWDVDFLHWGKFGYQALNPELYAREESTGGWNILSE